MKYSGIGVFKHSYDHPDRIAKFEERVVITEALSIEAAEKAILSEFREYSVEGIRFLDVLEVREVYDQGDSLVVDISNSMKVFEGSDEEYLSKHWSDQRPVSCECVGWQHVWYNRGGGKSGCYNCQEEHDGELWDKA
ncbi:MAG: hypothetical protein GY862_07930 [Gammaproteobacteria bacterium]|nr:hypothetical protein [Gammaproteobacteria bacterium]